MRFHDVLVLMAMGGYLVLMASCGRPSTGAEQTSEVEQETSEVRMSTGCVYYRYDRSLTPKFRADGTPDCANQSEIPQ